MITPELIGPRTNMLTGDGTTLNTGSTATLTSGAFSNLNGADFVVIDVVLGTIASGGGLSVLKVQSCDTSGGTYANVTGGDHIADGGTTIGDTADNGIYTFVIRTAGKPQFFKVIATTAGAANTVVKSIMGAGFFSKTNPPVTTGATVLKIA